MVRFSIVCPIKDEVYLIPKTLPSYYTLGPSEVILCVDKPAPVNVVKRIENVVKTCKTQKETRIIEVERNPEYKFHQAWVRREGFRRAANDLILTVDIDIVIDPEVRRYLPLVNTNRVALVSFSKIGYPITLRSAMAWLIQRFYYHRSFTGLYAFSKRAWQETEDVESLKRIPRGEDTHLHKFLTRRYSDAFIAGIKNYTLRPKESWQYQYLLGWNRWKIRKTSAWRVVLSTFIYLRPLMLVGYMKARFRGPG